MNERDYKLSCYPDAMGREKCLSVNWGCTPHKHHIVGTRTSNNWNERIVKLAIAQASGQKFSRDVFMGSVRFWPSSWSMGVRLSAFDDFNLLCHNVSHTLLRFSFDVNNYCSCFVITAFYHGHSEHGASHSVCVGLILINYSDCIPGW
jgi:hypothetical protein